MTRILIDTNIYSEFLRGNNEVKNTLKSAEVIGICVISIGELLSGFKENSFQMSFLIIPFSKANA